MSSLLCDLSGCGGEFLCDWFIGFLGQDCRSKSFWVGNNLGNDARLRISDGTENLIIQDSLGDSLGNL